MNFAHESPLKNSAQLISIRSLLSINALLHNALLAHWIFFSANVADVRSIVCQQLIKRLDDLRAVNRVNPTTDARLWQVIWRLEINKLLQATKQAFRVIWAFSYDSHTVAVLDQSCAIAVLLAHNRRVLESKLPFAQHP